MKFVTAIAAAVLGVAAVANTAGAVDSGTKPVAIINLKEFGNTLPPIGYVRYCIENKAECASWATTAQAVELTPDRWSTLFRINTYINNKIAPVSDQDLYGEIERWAMPRYAGDCEDYALLKQDYLKSLGFPANTMRMTVVLDEENQGHAVLTLVTNSGDFVLDNRRNDILKPADTKYTFLKRQSGESPRHWVALTSQQPRSTGAVATQEK
jgi:predicted transglutaminase-like cysteine proteinase